MHAKASAIAADSSETAILQNDSIETKTTNLNEKTEKLVLPTNDSSGKLLRIRHTVTYNTVTTHALVPVSFLFFG